MSPSLRGRPIRAALILLALTLCGFATSATAHAKQLKSERLVVRGGATVQLRLPDHFDNGEGGLCAPVTGQIVLGRGTPDRLTLGLAGDSCQDGNGPPPTASFTGLATWIVVKGTGSTPTPAASAQGPSSRTRRTVSG